MNNIVFLSTLTQFGPVWSTDHDSVCFFILEEFAVLTRLYINDPTVFYSYSNAFKQYFVYKENHPKK